jgi:hypothetical protein
MVLMGPSLGWSGEQASVGGQVLTAEPGGVGTGQERHHGRDIPRLAERRSAVLATVSSNVAPGLAARSISVSVAPGDTTFAVIPRRPSSIAATFVKFSSAPLAPVYSALRAGGAWC